MTTAYRVLAYLVAAGVAVQAAVIASGTFGLLSDVENGTVADSNDPSNAGFAIHSAVGTVAIPLLAIALLVVAFFATVPRGVVWAGYVLLVTLVQVALGFLSHAAAFLGIFHGLVALALFVVAVLAARRATHVPSRSQASGRVS